jgi:hypothetical protein
MRDHENAARVLDLNSELSDERDGSGVDPARPRQAPNCGMRPTIEAAPNLGGNMTYPPPKGRVSGR